MRKVNLVLIPGFGSNSIILKNLLDYLRNYFNIYIIDLPGFVNNLKPLKKISVENYASYAGKKIKKLGLKRYYVAGISFGFAVAQNIKFKKACLGIIAISPYLNRHGLGLNKFFLIAYKLIITIIIRFRLYFLIWESNFFKWILKKTGVADNLINETLKYVDKRTYFETANVILNYIKPVNLVKKPYILILGKDDKTINNNYVAKLFDKVPKALIIKISMPHLPASLDKRYFNKVIPRKVIQKIYLFIYQHERINDVT